MRPIHVCLLVSKVYPKSVYYEEASYISRKTNEFYTILFKNNDWLTMLQLEITPLNIYVDHFPNEVSNHSHCFFYSIIFRTSGTCTAKCAKTGWLLSAFYEILQMHFESFRINL